MSRARPPRPRRRPGGWWPAVTLSPRRSSTTSWRTATRKVAVAESAAARPVSDSTVRANRNSWSSTSSSSAVDRVSNTRGGVARHPVARAPAARARRLLVDGLVGAAGRRGRPLVGQPVEARRSPPEAGTTVTARRHQPPDLGQHLPLQQVVEHGPPRRHRHRARRSRARLNSLLPSTRPATRRSSEAAWASAAVGGQRLAHCGQIALEGRVHRATPARRPVSRLGFGGDGGDGLVDQVLVVGGLGSPGR